MQSLHLSSPQTIAVLEIIISLMLFIWSISILLIFHFHIDLGHSGSRQFSVIILSEYI